MYMLYADDTAIMTAHTDLNIVDIQAQANYHIIIH